MSRITNDRLNPVRILKLWWKILRGFVGKFILFSAVKEF